MAGRRQSSPTDNRPFLTRILRIAQRAGLAKPTLILGKAADEIRSRINGWPAIVRINPNPDRGQLSSIQLGLSSLDLSAQAGMIWPVDQPAVSENLVRSLTEFFNRSEALIAFPKHGDRRGHPAIFHRTVFHEFMKAPLTKGPKAILLRHEQHTIVLPTDEKAAVQDIDTPSDYEDLTGESLDRALARRRRT